MSAKASCVLCGYSSDSLVSEAESDVFNKSILNGETIAANEQGQGVCLQCASKFVYLRACGTQWLSPENSIAVGERMRVLVHRLYKLKRFPDSDELVLLWGVIQDISQIEAAMDREKAIQDDEASKGRDQ